METKFCLLFLVVSLYYAGKSDAVVDDDDDEVIVSLQLRLSHLEQQRAEDGRALLLLREKCERQPPALDLVKLEASLASLRADVASLAANKERESGRLSDLREMRLELDSVHSDYGKLKLELEGLKDRREEDLKVLGQQRNNQVTLKWLQKTSEELRREIGELAAAHNVSAAIRQQQTSDNALGLLRSDVIDLRNKLEEVRVTLDRNAATLALLQQDVTDLQNQRHQAAANYQSFREEVSQLKDEFLLTSKSPPSGWRSAPQVGSAPADDEEQRQEEGNVVVQGTATGAQKLKKKMFKDQTYDSQILDALFNGETHHRLRHRGRALKEVEELRVVVSGLQNKQRRTEHKLSDLKRNNTALESNLLHLWGRMADLLNSSRWRAARQSSLERGMDGLRDELKRLEQNGVETVKTIHNLTDTVSGIDKLHSSTIQLFEALEGLEDEYSGRIGDLHKEVSKFEFNMAQLSSTVNILKEDQSNQYTALKSTRADMSGIRQQVEDQNYRLVSLRSQVLHDEANSLLMQQQQTTVKTNQVQQQQPRVTLSRNEDQTSLLLDLESRVAEFDARLLSQSHLVNDTVDRLRNKADLDHVVHWAQSADKFDERIANVSRQVENSSTRLSLLESQLHQMYLQFPTDCSNVLGRKSGVYQIHPPGERKIHSVLCDMESEDGGGWTVIQNRVGVTSNVDFNVGWVEYRDGFGDVAPDGDYWMGNEALHRLSRRGASLRVEMWDEDGTFRYATYHNMRVEDEQHSYRLHVSGFEGNVSDALSYHQGMKFSSRDVDHDHSDTVNCAEQYEGGWWYKNCQHANLNGKYSLGLTWFDQQTNTWLQLQKVQIKIRPKKNLKL